MNLQDQREHFGQREWPGLRAPLAVRLLRKIYEDEHGCWLWTGGQNGQGYGLIRQGAVTRSAHIVSYLIFVGPVPPGLQLDHLCRVRHCVRPDHLEPVTAAENSRRALPATKTHCRQGHALTPDNLVPSKLPHRNCLTCSRERGRAQYERTKWSRPKWAAQREDVA